MTAEFDTFWEAFFARSRRPGDSVEKVLSAAVFINLLKVTEPVDLTILAGAPKIRELLAPLDDVPLRGKEVIATLPKLRDLVITGGAFLPEDLSSIAASPSLAKLHINRMTLTAADIAVLDTAPKLKELYLNDVRGVDAADLAQLSKLTQLTLKAWPGTDLGALATMPRLRQLAIGDVVADDLSFLAAPKLVSFSADHRAKNEDDLGLLASKSQLQSVGYPLADLSIVAGCGKLTSLCVDGSGPLDLEVGRELPLTSLTVANAPDEATAKGIIEHALSIWPNLSMTSYTAGWLRL